MNVNLNVYKNLNVFIEPIFEYWTSPFGPGGCGPKVPMGNQRKGKRTGRNWMTQTRLLRTEAPLGTTEEGEAFSTGSRRAGRHRGYVRGLHSLFWGTDCLTPGKTQLAPFRAEAILDAILSSEWQSLAWSWRSEMGKPEGSTQHWEGNVRETGMIWPCSLGI